MRKILRPSKDHQCKTNCEFQRTLLWQDAGLSIESSRNITLNARDANNKITNRLFLGKLSIQNQIEPVHEDNVFDELGFPFKTALLKMIGVDWLQRFSYVSPRCAPFRCFQRRMLVQQFTFEKLVGSLRSTNTFLC